MNFVRSYLVEVHTQKVSDVAGTKSYELMVKDLKEWISPDELNRRATELRSSATDPKDQAALDQLIEATKTTGE